MKLINTISQHEQIKLEEIALFRDLSPRTQDELLPLLRPIAYRAGDLIFQEGGPSLGLYVVLDGAIYYAKQCGQLKRQRILKILGPGDIAGEEALFSAGASSCHGFARALSDATLAVVERNSFLQILMRHPKLARRLSEWVIREVRVFECKLVEQSYEPLEMNLLRLLLTLMRRFGVREEDGIRIRLNLSRQDWADLLGAHLDTVIHELSKLRDLGIIGFKDHQITILDRAKLQDMLEIETTGLKEKLF